MPILRVGSHAVLAGSRSGLEIAWLTISLFGSRSDRELTVLSVWLTVWPRQIAWLTVLTVWLTVSPGQIAWLTVLTHRLAHGLRERESVCVCVANSFARTVWRVLDRVPYCCAVRLTVRPELTFSVTFFAVRSRDRYRTHYMS